MFGGEYFEVVNDEDEKLVRELFGNDLFEKVKSFGIVFQLRFFYDGLFFDIDILFKVLNLFCVFKVIKLWLVIDEIISLFVISLFGEQFGYV